MLKTVKSLIAKFRYAVAYDKSALVRIWKFERSSLTSLDNVKRKPLIQIFVREYMPGPGLFLFVRIPMRGMSRGHSYRQHSFGFRAHFKYSQELRDLASSMGISAYRLAGRTEN